MESLLSTMASVAASLVGFAGLLTAFRAANDSLSAYDANNVRSLLICAVSALVFALLPLPFAATRWSPWVGAVLTFLLGANLLFWSVRSPRWMKQKSLRPKWPLLYLAMIIAQALIAILLMVGSVFLADVAVLYAVGVLWFLIAALVIFVVQIFQLLPVEPSPPNR